jgi:hypothetical protein
MAKTTKTKKFKLTELEAKDSPVKNIDWEGEQLQTESNTKIEQDTGTGQEIVLRFFEFAANPQAFKDHKPTEQELFESHKNGIMALLWSDELRPYEAVEPRIMFSKDKTHYRIIVGCISSSMFVDKSRTLSQLLTNKK